MFLCLVTLLGSVIYTKRPAWLRRHVFQLVNLTSRQ